MNPDMYLTFMDFKGNIYYSVIFKMYIHFNAINVIKPVGKGYVGSIYAPMETIFIEPVELEPKSISTQHCFTVNSKDISGSIVKYIENNIERYITSDVWEQHKEKIFNRYIDDVKRKHNIVLDKSSLDYSIQYIWEAESYDSK